MSKKTKRLRYKNLLLLEIIHNLIHLDELELDLSDSLPDDLPEVKIMVDMVQAQLDENYEYLKLGFGVHLPEYRKL